MIRVQEPKQTKESARRYVIYCVGLIVGTAPPSLSPSPAPLWGGRGGRGGGLELILCKFFQSFLSNTSFVRLLSFFIIIHENWGKYCVKRADKMEIFVVQFSRGRKIRSFVG